MDTSGVHPRASTIAESEEPDPADALHELTGRSRAIAKGARVRLGGQFPQTAVLVVRGMLFRYARTRNGSRQIVALYFPGDWASLEAFLGTPFEGEIAAVARSEVRLIPCGEISALLDRSPRILRSLTIEALFQSRVQSAWLTRNSIMPAIASLAHFLCEVITRWGADGSRGSASCPFPFTQTIIAEALGLTPVHVNRTMRVLRERRLADVAEGMLRVNDLHDLSAMAEFDPRYLERASTPPPDPAGNRDFLTVVNDRPFERSWTGATM